MTSFLDQNGTQKGPKRTNKGPRNPRGAPGCPGDPPGPLFEGPGLPRGPLFNRKCNQNLPKTVSNPTKNDLVLVMVLALVLVLVLALVLVFVLVPALVGLASRGAPWAPQSPRGPIWTNLGAILVQFWCHLGSSWGAFGRNNNV